MRVKLGDICTKGASSLKQKDVFGKEGSYPVYGASGCIGTIDSFQQQLEYVAVVKDGAGIGRAMLLPAQSSVIGTMQYLLPKKGISAEYLFYVVQHLHLEKYFSGATIPHIYFKDYKNETFRCHPQDKQQRIIAVLGNTKKVIQKRKQQLDKLDELVKARFVEMFGEPNLGFPCSDGVELRECGQIVSGSTPKTTDNTLWGEDYTWITPAELKHNSGIIYESERKLSSKGIKSAHLQKLPKGTVILTSRAPIGKLAIAGREMYCNQGFKNIICNPLLHPSYLYHLLLYNEDYLNSLGRGATFKELSKSIVEDIKIKVPTLTEQAIFAAFVEEVDKSKVVGASFWALLGGIQANCLDLVPLK